MTIAFTAYFIPSGEEQFADGAIYKVQDDRRADRHRTGWPATHLLTQRLAQCRAAAAAPAAAGPAPVIVSGTDRS